MNREDILSVVKKHIVDVTEDLSPDAIDPAASMKDLGIEPANVSEAELKLARQLIGQQSAKLFDAASYVDEFKGRVEAAIQKKVEGKEISLAEKPAARPGPTSGSVTRQRTARGRSPRLRATSSSRRGACATDVRTQMSASGKNSASAMNSRVRS